MTKEDRIGILIETLENKLEEGLVELEKANPKTEEFTTCLNNTLTCFDLVSKLTYKPEHKATPQANVMQMETKSE